jgi:uncharacterized damage-inducible protein DinB
VPQQYAFVAIPDADIPPAPFPFARHMLRTYVSEINKTISVWRSFGDDDLELRPHPAATTVAGILRHQLLSERRFFGEFLGAPEPPPDQVLPSPLSIAACTRRLEELARARLPYLASRDEAWWLVTVPFFDVERERIWIFWRRVLHTAHHRTQLTVYLRAAGRPVPSTYGPTADVTWTNADPTTSVAAAGRRGVTG